MSLGLSTSDISYLNDENDHCVINLTVNVAQSALPNDQNFELTQREASSESHDGLLNLQTNSNGQMHSGDLLPDDALLSAATDTFVSNQFVQVTSKISIGLIGGSSSEATPQKEVVSTSTSVTTYTATTPTLTTQVSNMSPMNSEVVAVDRLSIPNVVVTDLPFPLGVKPSETKEVKMLAARNQVDTGITATPIAYVLSMMVQEYFPTSQPSDLKKM